MTPGLYLLLFGLLAIGLLLAALRFVPALSSSAAPIGASIFALLSIVIICFLLVENASVAAWAPDVLKVLVGVFVGSTISLAPAIAGQSGGVSTSQHASIVGDHGKIAGRDINEVLNEIVGDVHEIKNATVTQAKESAPRVEDIWFVLMDLQDGEPLQEVGKFYSSYGRQGWSLRSVTSHIADSSQVLATYVRPRDPASGPASVYFGDDMQRLA